MEILHKALEWAFNKFIKKDPSKCDHIWHVYGAALNTIVSKLYAFIVILGGRLKTIR